MLLLQPMRCRRMRHSVCSLQLLHAHGRYRLGRSCPKESMAFRYTRIFVCRSFGKTTPSHRYIHSLFLQRCCGVSENKLIDTCPVCHQPATGLRLIPMAFNEIDRAQAEAANTRLSDKRGKKRLNATVTRLNPLLNAREGTNDELGKSNAAESNELRTGRWTTEETEYCDQLIELFEGKSIICSSGPITERKIVSRRLAPSCSSWPDSNPGRNQIERFSVQHAQIKAV